MQVISKSNWSSYDLVGDCLLGSFTGQLLYIISSDDAAEDVPEEDQFKYVDILATIEGNIILEKLIDNDIFNHVLLLCYR